MKYSQLKQFSWSRADIDHLLPLTFTSLHYTLLQFVTKINCKIDSQVRDRGCQICMMEELEFV